MTSRQPDPERLTGNGELRRLLEGAIDALPDDFRTVFVLRAVEGMSIAETAEALSIRPETVKTRFHRARHRLQETLGARFDALLPATFEFGGERCDRIVAAVLARLRPSFDAARHDATRPATALPDMSRTARIPTELAATATAHEKGEPPMQRPLLSTAAIALFALAGAACASQAANAPGSAGRRRPSGGYQKVSDLVALPEFIPGLGTLYVQPATLPAGPFLAYDRDGRLVSTIYMIPLEDIEAQKKFDGLAVGAENVVDVDMYYNAGHPGVEKPHYHVVLWHVPEADAKLQ